MKHKFKYVTKIDVHLPDCEVIKATVALPYQNEAKFAPGDTVVFPYYLDGDDSTEWILRRVEFGLWIDDTWNLELKVERMLK